MPAPNADELARFHRWFAVEFNNRGWDLANQAQRTAEQNEELLRCAHAAALHWSAVGTALNEARADALLTIAHAKAGHIDDALRYADRQLERFAACDDAEPWDWAFAYAGLAAAHHARGDEAGKSAALDRARTHAESITNPKDRAIFDAQLPHLVPGAG